MAIAARGLGSAEGVELTGFVDNLLRDLGEAQALLDHCRERLAVGIEGDLLSLQRLGERLALHKIRAQRAVCRKLAQLSENLGRCCTASNARSRTKNWSSYNASLRKRGLLLIRVGKDLTSRAPHDGRPGRPAVFSDAAIQFCLSINVLFKLPLRQTAGMVVSLLHMAGLDWPVPDFSTLCRRQKVLAVQIPFRRTDGRLNLLVDSIGTKFLGDGEWQTRKHGAQGRRQWRKMHLAMDPDTSDIPAVEFTPSREGDSPVLPDLPGQIPGDEKIGTVPAHSAYDTRRGHKALADQQGTAFIPIRRNGRLWKEDCTRQKRHPERHPILRTGVLEMLDGIPRPQPDRDQASRDIAPQCPAGQWIRCLKSLGERVMTRDPDRQAAETHIRIALMNRFNELGTAEIVRIAWLQWGKGAVTPQLRLMQQRRTNANWLLGDDGQIVSKLYPGTFHDHAEITAKAASGEIMIDTPSETQALDIVSITRFSVEASAGPGALVDEESQTGFYAFNRRWVGRSQLDP